VSALQLAALVLVALGGGAVVGVSDPLRQTLVLGIYGLALTFLFFTFQAPDVALSEIVVAAIGMPLIILAALRKINAQQNRADEDDGQEEGG
jgi:energy-converting hydrogenase B subunit D